MFLGVPLGALAGLLGGWTDAAVSRLTEFFMGFPIILLLVALGWSVRQQVDGVTLHGVFAPGVLALTLLIGAFSWFYPARIVRASVLSLRKQDFIEAARMVGASTPRIIRSHMLPHLVGPVAVYFSIIAAANMVLESALSFLNIGIPLPDPSWGNMLATNWGHFFRSKSQREHRRTGYRTGRGARRDMQADDHTDEASGASPRRDERPFSTPPATPAVTPSTRSGARTRK